MKIGILGAKNIGSTLGEKWSAAGHEILFGVRNTGNPDLAAMAARLGASVGTAADAVRFGEVVVFAIPGQVMEETIQANAAGLQGKLVIDAANRVGNGVMNSLEIFQKYSPGVQYIRAFNTLGWENFAEPVINGSVIDLFYCAEAGRPTQAAEKLIKDVGLNPVNVGELNQIQLVDALTGIWFALAFGRKMGRRVAFKVLKE